VTDRHEEHEHQPATEQFPGRIGFWDVEIAES
jgi:hypothetical protein